MNTFEQGMPNLVDPISLTDAYLDESDWRTKENSNSGWSLGGLLLHQAGRIAASYWLDKIYSQDIAAAHKSCDFHIHDLSMLNGYCAGWSIRQLLEEGLGGVPTKVDSGPAHHLNSAMQQIVNYLGILQNEWAGAQAFSSFDTYLAPFIRIDKMDHKQIKQCMQTFLYGINTPSRWGCFDLDTKIEAENAQYSIELDDGNIVTYNSFDKIKTTNRGLIFVKDLTEEDDIEI